MIVNYTDKGWEIITQRAHGLLAAKIAAHWNHKIRTKRWTETLLAIAEHDDAQIELEKEELLTSQGGPLDYKMTHFEPDHCSRTMNASLSKSRYIALLCSMHLEFVFRSQKGSDDFLKEQTLLRQQWRNELSISKKQAQKDYNLLEWCDALSLLLCQQDSQPQERMIEISRGYNLIRSDQQTLRVDPWPFEEAHFDIYFEYRQLDQLVFGSVAEFRSNFMSAKPQVRNWKFIR